MLFLKSLKLLLIFGCGAALISCGGSSSGVSPSLSAPTASVSGSAVKGPWAGADVFAYQVDPNVADLKGLLLGQGVTDSAAAITDLSILANTTGLVLLEFVVNVDTTDIGGGDLVLDTLITIVDAARIINAEPIYATPLTTMASQLAVQNADQNGGAFSGNGDNTTSEAEFLAALAVASNQVTSTFGFGLLNGVDVFSATPLLNDDIDSSLEVSSVAAYRMAVEGAAAIFESIVTDDTSNTLNSEQVLSLLVDDLSDGALDGSDENGVLTEFNDVSSGIVTLVTADPLTLLIPGTGTAITDINDVLSAETNTTGTVADTTELDNDAIVTTPTMIDTSPDSDADGIADDVDNCLTDANNDQTNTDGLNDGGDVCDNDDDEDGTLDVNDAFPLDDSEDTDTDGDNIGNNTDTDDDDDGTPDSSDAFPLDDSEDTDTDGDMLGNNADNDDDNDGTLDVDDAFPLDDSEDTDTDGDMTGDNSDIDDDGDTVNDSVDNCPLIQNLDQADDDVDSIGNVCDNCPNDANTDQADSDNNNVGDVCEAGNGPSPANWDQFDWDDGSTWQ